MRVSKVKLFKRLEKEVEAIRDQLKRDLAELEVAVEKRPNLVQRVNPRWRRRAWKDHQEARQAMRRHDRYLWPRYKYLYHWRLDSPA